MSVKIARLSDSNHAQGIDQLSELPLFAFRAAYQLVEETVPGLADIAEVSPQLKITGLK